MIITGVRQRFASASIHALPLPPRHKDTKYTKWGKRESLLVRPIQCPNVETGIWRISFCPYNTAFSAKDCTDFHRFSSMLADCSVKIRDHPWQKQNTPVSRSKHSTWLFFVPSWLRGSVERVAAQKNDAHPIITYKWHDSTTCGRISGQSGKEYVLCATA